MLPDPLIFLGVCCTKISLEVKRAYSSHCRSLQVSYPTWRTLNQSFRWQGRSQPSRNRPANLWHELDFQFLCFSSGCSSFRRCDLSLQVVWEPIEKCCDG